MDISVLDNKLILTKHFDNTIDELLSLIPTVEQEELRNKLYEVFDEWNNSHKEDNNGTRKKL